MSERRQLVAVVVAALTLVAGSVVWWQSSTEETPECDVVRGSLAEGDLYARCKASVDADAELTVVGAPKAGQRLDLRGRFQFPGEGTLPVAVGAGWSGVLSGAGISEQSATTTLILHCAGATPDMEVNVSHSVGYQGYDDPRERVLLVRSATRDARLAAARWGCRTTFGKTVTSVPLPVDEEEYKPAGQANGTCAGLPFGRTKAVTTARETAAADGPYEKCVLGDEDGTGMYALTAAYGPYAQELRGEYNWRYDDGPTPTSDVSGKSVSRDSFLWAGATCPGTDGRSFYTVQLGSAVGPWTEPSFARAALVEFAKRSAERHGCTDLRLP